MLNVPTYQPTWHQNLARNASEARYPHLWKGVVLNLQPGLGPTGLTLRDVSGRGNNGTLTNMDPATDWVNDGRWSLDFNAASSLVSTSNSGNYPQGNAQRMISFWFNARFFPTGTNRRILEYAAGGNGESLFFGAEDSALSIGYGGHRLITPSVLSTDVWYHAMFLVLPNATTTDDVAVYINGVIQNLSLEAGSAQTLNTTTPSPVFGNRSDGLTPFNGQLDDIHIHNRGAVPSEAQLLHQLGRGGWLAKRQRVFAKAPVAPPVGGILVHPGMTGGIPQMAGGMRG